MSSLQCLSWEQSKACNTMFDFELFPRRTNLRINSCLCGLFLFKEWVTLFVTVWSFSQFTRAYQATHVIMIWNCPYLYYGCRSMMLVDFLWSIYLFWSYRFMCISFLKPRLAFWRSKTYLCKTQILLADTCKLEKNDQNFLNKNIVGIPSILDETLN